MHNVTDQSARQIALDCAAGCDLYDGPDHPAFERAYFDPLTAIECAFASEVEGLITALEDRAKAQELYVATAALQAAMDGGSIEARDLASRSLAGLWLTLTKTAGFQVLQDYQNEAWSAADLDSRRANAYAARTYDRVDA